MATTYTGCAARVIYGTAVTPSQSASSYPVGTLYFTYK